VTVFIERFILAILAALVVIVAVTNPLGLSAATRVIVTTVIFIIAGVAAYAITVHKHQNLLIAGRS
jgi:hypothetical protein